MALQLTRRNSPQKINRSVREFVSSSISEDARDRAVILYSYGMDEKTVICNMLVQGVVTQIFLGLVYSNV